MARQGKGILGAPKGRVGNLLYYSRNGREVVQKMGARIGNKDMKRVGIERYLSMLSAWYVGFGSAATLLHLKTLNGYKGNGIQRCVKYNMDNTVTLASRNYTGFERLPLYQGSPKGKLVADTVRDGVVKFANRLNGINGDEYVIRSWRFFGIGDTGGFVLLEQGVFSPQYTEIELSLDRGQQYESSPFAFTMYSTVNYTVPLVSTALIDPIANRF